MESKLRQIETLGFAVLPGVFPPAKVNSYIGELASTLHSEVSNTPSIRSRAGDVYAARNVLDVFPQAAALWQTPPLLEFLQEVLGCDFGLVRALYFDKPPGQSWSLPWHKDLTIAVENNRLPSERFRKPTVKAGVPHVEAPAEVLAAMLTLRIHLDDATPENGPLKVIPGSHLAGQAAATIGNATTIYCRRGDVLAMRPLLSHASGVSAPGTREHRRVLHLEFSGLPELPDGYRWRWYVRRTELAYGVSAAISKMVSTSS